MNATPAAHAAPRLPSGWFVVGEARALRPGQVQPLDRFGRELVLFRTASGTPALVDATCPHLGAHLGHGGTVVGETLQCPMHGFRFGTHGACTAAGKAAPPRGVRLGSLPLTEREGLIFAWFGADGQAPSFALPAIDSTGWPTWRLRRAVVDAHPQDTTENSVDLAHFEHVHGYDAVQIVQPLRRDGAGLSIAYSATRRTGPFGTPLTFQYEVAVTGLGLSQVTVRVPGLATCQLLVMASPLDAARSEVWLAARVQVAAPALRGIVDPLASSIMATILRNDVEQDARLWSHKRWVHPPRLSSADGPIGAYRAWARQFQPQTALGQETVSC
ncbi:MAG: Rieske (2Fe-2S) protein [Alphaproteobacteria bacterium]|nr:Rieske (2Fe-2S) protein [Alphaproteobacteria bacterium]